MSVLMRYAGLDLPVHEPEEAVLRTPAEFKAAADGGLESFVRVARVRGLGFSSLKSCLVCADRAFNAVSELCEARLVDYEWGLSPRPAQYDESAHGKLTFPKELLPDGYMLVAQVQSILGARKVPAGSEVSNSIRRGLVDYRLQQAASEPRLDDMSVSQFVLEASSDSTEPIRWLVDIEPRFQSQF